MQNVNPGEQIKHGESMKRAKGEERKSGFRSANFAIFALPLRFFAVYLKLCAKTRNWVWNQNFATTFFLSIQKNNVPLRLV